MASVKKSSLTISKVITIIFLIIWGSAALGRIVSLYFNSEIKLADGFTINSYKVIINVNEDNIIDVTEKITVNWYENGHHGIYKFTPEWYEYTSSDGKTIKRKAILSNYSAVGENYVTDIVKKKPRIKIGDANKTLPLGLYTYTINYTYNMGKDPYPNTDEFIFHAFGDYWGTTINNASLEIHMPNNFNLKNISFWDDKYRNNNITSKVNYYVNNNTLYANVSSDYDLMKSLTVDILLPNGYFVGGTNNYGYISLMICLIIVIISILSFCRWIKYGKNHDKVASSVEFYPPENYDAAQIGYIYGRQTSKKLAISLIVQLASKGYIQINESDDKKYRTIINLYPKHNEDKGNNDVNIERRTIMVSKLKDADELLSKGQKIWMKYLFRNGNTKNIVAGFNMFFQKSEGLIDKYLKIDSDITEKKEENNDDINKNVIQIDKQMESLSKLTETEQIVYDALFSSSDANDISLDSQFYTVFDKIAKSLEKQLKDKVHDKKAKNQMIKTIIWLIAGAIGYYYAWSIVEDMNPSYNFLYTLAFISLFGITLFSFIMGRKTEYGETITARVLGFRNYIDKAEKSQIEKLVEDNPNYFYDILPYAYAMNVSQKWIKNFENIPLPKTNMGNFDYLDMTSFSSISDSIHYPVSSGGSGSSGGGCSSCGGGCSSCGGGGSW